jgi:hypothetical protein
MAKGRDNRGREDKRKKKKPKKDRIVPIPAVSFQHHAVVAPPAEKNQD